MAEDVVGVGEGARVDKGRIAAELEQRGPQSDRLLDLERRRLRSLSVAEVRRQRLERVPACSCLRFSLERSSESRSSSNAGIVGLSIRIRIPVRIDVAGQLSFAVRIAVRVGLAIGFDVQLNYLGTRLASRHRVRGDDSSSRLDSLHRIGH